MSCNPTPRPASPASGSFITTTCPRCGPSDIGIDRVVLRVDEGIDRAAVSIHCPVCGSRFTKQVDDAMSLLMATVGVEIHTVAGQADVDERPHDTAPITQIELEQFAAALASTDDVLAVLAES
ncbi:MAG TPA: hypothetical protein VJM33_17560 [Microthrixaceae bacterium]|nr:hypothetical protein [Microthrixaceae bacterium]